MSEQSDAGPRHEPELVRLVGEALEDAAMRWLGRDLGTIHRDDIARVALDVVVQYLRELAPEWSSPDLMDAAAMIEGTL